MSLVFETATNLQNRLNSIDPNVQCKMDTTLEVKIQNVFDMVASGRGGIQSDEALDEEKDKKSKPQLVPQTTQPANPGFNLLRVPSIGEHNRSRKKSIEASLL